MSRQIGIPLLNRCCKHCGADHMYDSQLLDRLLKCNSSHKKGFTSLSTALYVSPLPPITLITASAFPIAVASKLHTPDV